MNPPSAADTELREAGAAASPSGCNSSSGVRGQLPPPVREGVYLLLLRAGCSLYPLALAASFIA